MTTLLKITFEYLIYTIIIVSNPSCIRKQSVPQYVQVIEETEDSYICGPVKNY